MGATLFDLILNTRWGEVSVRLGSAHMRVQGHFQEADGNGPDRHSFPSTVAASILRKVSFLLRLWTPRAREQLPFLSHFEGHLKNLLQNKINCNISVRYLLFLCFPLIGMWRNSNNSCSWRKCYWNYSCQWARRLIEFSVYHWKYSIYTVSFPKLHTCTPVYIWPCSQNKRR